MNPIQRTLALAAGLLALAACGDAGRQPVSPDGAAPRLTITSSIVTCPDTISVGQTAQCVAYFYDQNNNLVTTSPTWSSGTPSLASVSSSGQVTGVAVGSASVQATAGGVTGTRSVYVKPGLTVGISGPSTVRRFTSCTWTRSASGGTAPYTYAWTNDNTHLDGTGVYYTADALRAVLNITLVVTDANGVQATATKSVSATNTAPLC